MYQDQYVFIYDAVLEATMVGETVIPAHLFRNIWEGLRRSGKGSETRLAQQYKVSH